VNKDLQASFGNIDIYLFDQLLKGSFDHCKRVLDVGCGEGRNIVYFLNNGFDVSGVDRVSNAISTVKGLSARLAPANPVDNFVVAAVEDMPFADASFDVVICSAVLHFAADEDHFDKMVRSIWRILQPGGYLFARMASDIGIETLVQPIGNGKYLLPDGSVRFLVNEETLIRYTRDLNGKLTSPLKPRT
jgi:tellurite methyltransferase